MEKTLPLAYRSDPSAPTAPSSTVEVSREEYAHLQRANVIMKALENPDCIDIWDHRSRHSRRRWEISFWGFEDERTGFGATIVEAVEDALNLPPVTVFVPETVPLPWKRFTLLGAALALMGQYAASWLF